MPAIGLGTWKMDDGVATPAVTSAIELGYRHIDCAAIYNNEPDVGRALQDCLSRKVLSREQLWVTSKLWCNRHRPELVESALKQTLHDLQLEYLDLYMIHWPIVFRHDLERPEKGEHFIPLSEVPLADTWSALEACVDAGLCRNLGVCNFNSDNLATIKASARIQPAANQVECHPFLPQRKLKNFCDDQSIQFVAYSPLGSGDRPERMRDDRDPNLFEDSTVVAIANERQITIGQVLLSWLVNRGMVAIPKSCNEKRLAENLAAGDIVLSNEQMEAIDSIATQHRFVHGKFWEQPGSPYTAAGIWGND